MRKYGLLFAFFIAFQAFAQEQDAGMSLQDCIEYALTNNERLRITELGKEDAESQVGEVLAIGLPQVNIDGGLNYNYKVQRSIIDASNFDPNVPEGTETEIAFGQPYDGNVAVGLSQLIFDGSYFVGLEAAKTFRELAAKEHVRQEIDVIEAVAKAYYLVLINSERLELLDRNYSRLDTLLFETTQMYENGFAEKIDVGRIRVNFNNTRVDRDRARRLNEVGMNLLKFQMGMDLNEPITLSDDLEDVPLEVPEIEESFDYNNRIEFSQILTNQGLAQLDMKNNRAQYLPKLYANFNYGFNTAAPESSLWFQGDRWLGYGAVGVSLNIPVFDGRLKYHRIQRNKIQISQLEYEKSYLKRNIDIEIQQAVITLEANIETLEVSRDNMELADEIFTITKIKFQEGVGSNLEVVDADASLVEAQTNYYNALYDAVLSQIDLRKALGRIKSN